MTPPVETKQLEQAILDAVAKRIRVYPRRSIWASQLTHPCLRQNEYALTRWQDQQTHDVHLQQIFDEGNIHEAAVEQTLKDAGFLIRQTQQPLDEAVMKDGRRMKYNISGRLDKDLSHPVYLTDIWVPTEFKTMADHIWQSIETIEDMKNHRHWYIRLYPGQLNTYLLIKAKELGLFLLKNKTTGALKFIWNPIDYQLGELALTNAELINEAVERIEADPQNADQYLTPRIPFDEKICGKCAFAHICLPDAQFGGVELDVSEETEIMLRKRQELKVVADQYKELDEEVKGLFKKKKPGLYLVGGSFNVKVEEKHRDGFTVAPSDFVQVSIKALKTKDEKAEVQG